MALSIISVNIHSLVRKMPAILDLIHTYSPDIICIQETWLHPAVANTLIGIENYSLVRTDRPDHSGYGGVLMYVRSSLDHSLLPPVSSSTFESTGVRLVTRNQAFAIITIYRPPHTNISRFTAELQELLRDIKSLILIGDFNIDPRTDRGAALNQFLARNNRHSCIMCPPLER